MPFVTSVTGSVERLLKQVLINGIQDCKCEVPFSNSFLLKDIFPQRSKFLSNYREKDLLAELLLRFTVLATS